MQVLRNKSTEEPDFAYKPLNLHVTGSDIVASFEAEPEIKRRVTDRTQALLFVGLSSESEIPQDEGLNRITADMKSRASMPMASPLQSLERVRDEKAPNALYAFIKELNVEQTNVPQEISLIEKASATNDGPN